jgi:hypothetical protein
MYYLMGLSMLIKRVGSCCVIEEGLDRLNSLIGYRPHIELNTPGIRLDTPASFTRPHTELHAGRRARRAKRN